MDGGKALGTFAAYALLVLGIASILPDYVWVVLGVAVGVIVIAGLVLAVIIWSDENKPYVRPSWDDGTENYD